MHAAKFRAICAAQVLTKVPRKKKLYYYTNHFKTAITQLTETNIGKEYQATAIHMPCTSGVRQQAEALRCGDRSILGKEIGKQGQGSKN